ncbi:MAG: response regulator [Lachnospiraceae bacterium]|nr:response regulator [Lachnospiraceae bacterium]
MLPPFGYTEVTLTGDGYALPLNIEGKDLILYVAIDSDIQIDGEATKAESVAAEASANANGPKVLIVDDSRTSRKILRAVLEEAGYNVVDEALNGAEGVEKYKQHQPAVCTMDITMPVMDGIEALKVIREFDPNAKVVMLTAAGQQSKIVEAVKSGAAEFITKPFEKDEVIRTLAEITK